METKERKLYVNHQGDIVEGNEDFLGAVTTGLNVAKGIKGLFGNKGGNDEEETYRPQRVAVKAAYNAGDFAKAEQIWATIPPGGRITSTLEGHMQKYGSPSIVASYSMYQMNKSTLAPPSNIPPYPSQKDVPYSSQATPPKEEEKDKTMLYVGIGGGALLLIGLIVFLIVRK